MKNDFSFISNAELSAFEQMYQLYLNDPKSVDESWQSFFKGFDFAQASFQSDTEQIIPDEFKVRDLIRGYRARGHLFTKTNPVRKRRDYSPTLYITNFGLTEKDLQKEFHAGNEIGIGKATLKEIINHLEATYCQSIGVEYKYIRDTEIERWLQQKMEQSRNTPNYNKEQKKQIFTKLNEAVEFEHFIHRRFPGQKRFSLEGVESVIPALDAIIEKGASLGTKEFVIGMPHRGRLNVLANIMKKPYSEMLSEFKGLEYEDEELMGDVKYHLGQTYKRTTNDGNNVILTLTPNPSHLETVNPIVEGLTRARIDQKYQGNTKKITPILLHGDASFAGQGVVYEVVQMSGLKGYSVGGTVHIVLNNQIGFTTNYLDARTSTYCTDVAKIIQSPIFHVNADDVEAVVFAVNLAMEYREKFHKDVFIDLLGYRKYGHNEGDEPRFTQPVLYDIIAKHPNPAKIYVDKLKAENALSETEIKEINDSFIANLEKCFIESKEIKQAKIPPFLHSTWKGIERASEEDFHHSIDTDVNAETLAILGKKITDIPDEKMFFRKSVKLMNDRKKMLENKTFDWAMGELLAYASLLNEGYSVRVSGQDVERGTFSHRHSVLTHAHGKGSYIPLKNTETSESTFEIYNSSLSEYGVLGFEYGYALTSPKTLTIWEAQFGDFNNGAQIIIDQYISSAKEKWNVKNGLVMLMPHGYEGQGPEHSSGRMERFLSLCADENMQVANVTTPANFFHLLRRQMHRNIRLPLVVFTPKSLLRHPKAVSNIDDFTQGGFKELIDDATANPKKIKAVVLCSGKIYYDLLSHKEALKNEEVAIVRVEQIYPFPHQQLEALKKKYTKAERWVWTQEEPLNMGGWPFIQNELRDMEIHEVGRSVSGSPATGSSTFHKLQQQKIIDKTFLECDCYRLNMDCHMACIGNKWRSFDSKKSKEGSK